MRVIKSLEQLPCWRERRPVVALGNFDGVHRGHQQLLGEMVEYARCAGALSAVFLFHPHPQQVLDPDHAPGLLLDLEKKIQIFESLKIEIAVIVPFNQEMASLTPDQFVKEVLVNRLQVEGVFVGFNYRFGRGARGTPELLVHFGQRYGFQVRVIPPITWQGRLVSSTRVREALLAGDILQARELLGYWPLLRGTVIKGDQRGRTLGFPTANLDLTEDLLVPASGVYAGQALLQGQPYPTVLNIGYRPTFYGDRGRRSIEAYLVHYQGVAYGEQMEVELYQRLRDEQKFPNAEGLIRQIQRDLQATLRICARSGASLAF